MLAPLAPGQPGHLRLVQQAKRAMYSIALWCVCVHLRYTYISVRMPTQRMLVCSATVDAVHHASAVRCLQRYPLAYGLQGAVHALLLVPYP